MTLILQHNGKHVHHRILLSIQSAGVAPIALHLHMTGYAPFYPGELIARILNTPAGAVNDAVLSSTHNSGATTELRGGKACFVTCALANSRIPIRSSRVMAGSQSLMVYAMNQGCYR